MITLILPYYHNAGMLVEQANVINRYPAEIRQNLQVIVVDDCSAFDARAEKVIESGQAQFKVDSFKLYRILTDLRWNWLQCRNLGAKEADGEWLFLTDIDHIVPVETMQYLHDNTMGKVFKGDRFYTFDRVNYALKTPLEKMEKYKPHPNTYFMSKKLYWKIGGYDEVFAGNYGTDGMYRRRCLDEGRQVQLANMYVARVDRQIIPDASTLPNMLDRKDNRAPGILEEILEYKEQNKVPIQTLKLPWRRVI